MAGSKIDPSAQPLKAAEYKLINQGLYRLSQAQEELDRAKLAGLDVGQLQDMHDEVLAQLTLVKQTYFPGQP